MKSIDVEFVPGERVVVKPKGIATLAREGVIQRVAAYYGGCRSYRVRCQDDQGAIFTQVLNADEIVSLSDEGGEKGTEARRDEGTEGEEGNDVTIAWTAKLPGPANKETFERSPMRTGTVLMLCMAFLLCIAGIAVTFSSAGCAAAQRIDTHDTLPPRPTDTQPAVPDGTHIEPRSNATQSGAVNANAQGNTGFAFSTTVGAGIVAIFTTMMLAFFGYLTLLEVLSHKRAMARDALAIGGGR